MNLDEQLRAALNQEADVVQAPAPDVDSLISGGTVRRRRRNRVRLGVGAAVVAVLVGGGAYAVTQLDPEAAVDPTGPPPPTTVTPYLDNGAAIEPGTYRMLVGVDAAGVAIDADLTVDGEGWTAGNYPVAHAGSYGGVGVYQPIALAAGTGCLTDEPNRDVAETSETLAQQLAQLPRSTVVQAPATVQAFGRDAVHLRLRIDSDCGAGAYRVAETVRGSHGITYTDVDPSGMVVVDFWVVDVDGTPVVVDTWHDDDASTPLVDQVARTGDSITFVTGG